MREKILMPLRDSQGHYYGPMKRITGPKEIEKLNKLSGFIPLPKEELEWMDRK
jgi:hypothetical protein